MHRVGVVCSNPGVKTIDDEIVKALLASGLALKANLDDLAKVSRMDVYSPCIVCIRTQGVMS